jgi:hypothetical protein
MVVVERDLFVALVVDGSADAYTIPSPSGKSSPQIVQRQQQETLIIVIKVYSLRDQQMSGALERR